MTQWIADLMPHLMLAPILLPMLTAALIGASCSIVKVGRAATSAAVRTGVAKTGPRPATISTSTPASFGGMTMSE